MALPKQETEEKQKANDGFFKMTAPKKIESPTGQIDKLTVLFWIERSKNKNIVVYEADKNPSTADHYNTVVGYWLDIDPEFVKAARKKGVNSDRAELSYMEKKLAYGYNVSSTVNNKKK
eukprot:127485_1